MIVTRQHLGLILPPVPPAKPRQEMLTLEAGACLPPGFDLLDEGGSLQLVRLRDGARLGVMASFEFACRHASVIARAEAWRGRAVADHV